MGKTDITRKGLQKLLGGRTFSLRHVGFLDLGRDDVYVLGLLGVPLGLCSSGDRVKFGEIRRIVNEIRKNHTYQGKHIL